MTCPAPGLADQLVDTLRSSFETDRAPDPHAAALVLTLMDGERRIQPSGHEKAVLNLLAVSDLPNLYRYRDLWPDLVHAFVLYAYVPHGTELLERVAAGERPDLATEAREVAAKFDGSTGMIVTRAAGLLRECADRIDALTAETA